MSKKKTMFCRECGRDQEFELSQFRKEINVRGIPIDSFGTHYVCPLCESSVHDPEDNVDHLEVAYRIYRQRMQKFQPEMIKKIREFLGMSQIEFAVKVGNVIVDDISRYERGALQPEDFDDRVLRLLYSELEKIVKKDGNK